MNRISKCMLAAAVLAAATDGFAQDHMQSPAVHANRGQSQAQQSRDADSCMVMARKRTGVDPTVLAANSTPLQEGKGLSSQPIDQPTMAMNSSGTGDMSQGGQMGSSGTGATGSSGQMGSSGAGATGSSGQMASSGAGATGSSGQMGSTGTGTMASSGSSGTGTTGSSAMGAQSAGATGTSGTSGMSSSGAASADMGSSGSSGAMGATGASGASGAMGTTGASGTTGESGKAMASSGSTGTTGTMGKGHPAGKSGGKLAMVTADDYNTAFSKCMSSRGYTVESGASSGN
jgi:hypothetical protein